jgi:pyruvate dehydrogenase complex dehydrogenase (E1) component
MNFHHKRHLIKFITIALITSLTTGCTVWTSVPETVDQHYGDAVRNMIINQTLYNEQTDNDIPLLNMDGEKAQTIINAYRQPPSEKLEKAKQGVAFDAKSVGGTTN